MIVISGALVLVAAVLLVLGIISSITLVYAAIGLSIVSAVFLLVGVFQRPAPAGEPRESESDGTRRQVSRRDDEGSERPARQPVKASKAAEPDEPQYDDSDRSRQSWEPAEPDGPVGHIDLVDADLDAHEVSAEFPLEQAHAAFETRSGATGADVLVISGRPRYHVGGCEYVEGHDDSEPLEINEARELGFTPCGACRPNETLARSAAGKEHAAHPKPSPMRVSEPATARYEPAPATVAAPVADPQQNHQSYQAPSALPQQAAPATTSPPVSQPVAYSPPPAQPAAPAAPPAAPPVAAPPAVVTPPLVAEPAPPVAAPPVAQPAVAEPPAAGRAGRAARTVLAVASTKEYHRPDCEMLVGAVAQEITRVAAIRQGYLACGICKP